MVHSLLLAFALLAPNENIIVVPDHSPFAIEEAGEEYGSSVRFNGELRLEGQYQFEWVVIDGKPEWLELRLVPNEVSLKLIPFAADKPVSELLVRDALVVARSILTAPEADKLLQYEVLVKQGVGVFRVGALETAVDCDSRSYVVDVIDAKPTQLVAGLKTFPPRVGC